MRAEFKSYFQRWDVEECDFVVHKVQLVNDSAEVRPAEVCHVIELEQTRDEDGRVGGDQEEPVKKPRGCEDGIQEIERGEKCPGGNKRKDAMS